MLQAGPATMTGATKTDDKKDFDNRPGLTYLFNSNETLFFVAAHSSWQGRQSETANRSRGRDAKLWVSFDEIARLPKLATLFREVVMGRQIPVAWPLKSNTDPAPLYGSQRELVVVRHRVILPTVTAANHGGIGPQFTVSPLQAPSPESVAMLGTDALTTWQ